MSASFGLKALSFVGSKFFLFDFAIIARFSRELLGRIDGAYMDDPRKRLSLCAVPPLGRNPRTYEIEIVLDMP
jgi:hypothetical protein